MNESPATFCADYAGVFVVQSESKPGKSYTVTISGPKGPHCTCPAFYFSHGECKHLTRVWREGCFWNPAWSDGGPHTTRPVWISSGNVLADERCPNCDGPLIAVRIAV